MPKTPANRVPAAGGNGPESIYNPKKASFPYNLVPWTMYFYYIGPSPEGMNLPLVRHYFYEHVDPSTGAKKQIDDGDILGILQKLARAARTGAQYQGQDWKYIWWNRISYIGIFADVAGGPLKDNQALGFNHDHGGRPNHTFFDAKDWTVDLGDSDGMRDAVTFINHFKEDASGLGPLDKGHQYFNFNLNPPSPVPVHLGPWTELLYPDSGGTNMGPPIPPPST